MAGWLLEEENLAINLAAGPGTGREGTGRLEHHRDRGGLKHLTIAPLRKLLEGSQVQKRRIPRYYRVSGGLAEGAATWMSGLSCNLLLPQTWGLYQASGNVLGPACHCASHRCYFILHHWEHKLKVFLESHPWRTDTRAAGVCALEGGSSAPHYTCSL